uniref:Lysozyme n=1 Tax=Caenorhabditis tropicalis TaxID=1561998 RepID=A0A1I7UX98_9PELO
MLLKFVAIISVFTVIAQSVPVLPFIDSSLPIKFREVIAEPAPSIPSNLASYASAVDFSDLASLAELQYIKQSGYSVIFVRVYTQGSFDQNACSTIYSAYNAGLGTEPFMFPQPLSNKPGNQQLDEVYQGLTECGITVRSIWIQVTTPINWSSYPNNNISFINSIVTRARQYGITVGIYTSYSNWSQITNGYSNIGNDVLLWYWSVFEEGANGETPANFDDFRAFGCWTVPTVKQFAQMEKSVHWMLTKMFMLLEKRSRQLKKMTRCIPEASLVEISSYDWLILSIRY